MSLVTQPPGIATPLHRHTREAEALFVLEGVIEYRAGEETYELTQGSFLYLPLGVPHAFRIRGDSPARFVSLTAPGGLMGLYDEVGVPAAGDARADRGRGADDGRGDRAAGTRWGRATASRSWAHRSRWADQRGRRLRRRSNVAPPLAGATGALGVWHDAGTRDPSEVTAGAALSSSPSYVGVWVVAAPPPSANRRRRQTRRSVGSGRRSSMRAGGAPNAWPACCRLSGTTRRAPPA